MPEFQYIAREMSGSQITGLQTAASEQEVAAGLASRQLFPIKIHLAEAAVKKQKQAGRKVRARHLSTFYSQLADLLKSGVPLLRSLELLERQAVHPSLQLVLEQVRQDVAQGTPLAEALRMHPRVFGELAVSMVHAGEEGSFLEDVLKRIAAFTEHQEELKSRVLGAVVYPIFLLVAGSIIVSVMIVWFVPQFEPIFERMEEQGGLPWATTLLLGLSNTLSQYGLLVIAFIVAAIFAFIRHVKTEQGAYQFDQLRLKTIGLGPIVRSLAISRFCRILGTLLQNGVPLLQSLKIAKGATGNKVLSAAIGDAAENISAGKSLAKPLAVSKQFPEEIVEMISVGEEANNLEQVLINIAENMERRTYRQLDLFVRLLEPILLMIMAAVIVFVAAGLLMPVIQSAGLL